MAINKSSKTCESQPWGGLYSGHLQQKVSQAAFDTFKTFWSNPYIFRSDADWFNTLRCVDDKVQSNISIGLVCEFFFDYGLARQFRFNRSGNKEKNIGKYFMHHLQCHAECNPNPFSLANTWKSNGITKNKPISAATKLLFFMRPDQEIAILDKYAVLGAKGRCRFGQLRDDEVQYKNYKNFLLGVAKSLEKDWKNKVLSVGAPDCKSPNFLLRRMADKQLFIEGRTIELFIQKNKGQSKLEDCLSDAIGEVRQ